MTDRIALAQQKGGVGKTTLTINVGGALAEQGEDVLLVDLDPQGHLTEGVGKHDRYDDEPPHLGTVLTDLDSTDAINDLVVENPEFDVLPSNVDMFQVESDLTGAVRARERLGMAFEDLETDYDCILVDCPPSLGHLTDNALLACESVLIPALAEGTSIRALEILYDQIESLESAFDVRIRERGLVANRVEQDGEATEMMEWFEETLPDDIPVWEVRKRVKLKRAWNNGVSLFAHEETCDMEAEFQAIAGYLAGTPTAEVDA